MLIFFMLRIHQMIAYLWCEERERETATQQRQTAQRQHGNCSGLISEREADSLFCAKIYTDKMASHDLLRHYTCADYANKMLSSATRVHFSNSK